jgi:hypothetical protein
MSSTKKVLATAYDVQSGPTETGRLQGGLTGEIRNKLGITLINQGLVDPDIVIKAANLKDKSSGKSIDNRKRRSLAQILVNDFNVDHDITFSNVAAVYGFREIQLKDIAESWKLPVPLVNAIKYHHNPVVASREDKEVHLVHIANVLAHTNNIGHSGNLFPDKISKLSLEILGIDDDELPGLWDSLKIDPDFIKNII